MPDSGTTVEPLQATTLTHLHSVNLTTPAQQLHEVLATLLEVPTFARQIDSDFTRRMEAALVLLRARTRQLADVVERLEALMPATASGGRDAPLSVQSVES